MTSRAQDQERHRDISRRQALRKLAAGLVSGSVFFVAFASNVEFAAAECGAGNTQPDGDCGTGTGSSYQQDARCGTWNQGGNSFWSDIECGQNAGQGKDPDSECGKGPPFGPDQTCGSTAPNGSYTDDGACGKLGTEGWNDDSHCGEAAGNGTDHDDLCGKNPPHNQDGTCGSTSPTGAHSEDNDCGDGAADGSRHKDNACGETVGPTGVDSDDRCGETTGNIVEWDDSCGKGGDAQHYQEDVRCGVEHQGTTTPDWKCSGKKSPFCAFVHKYLERPNRR